MRNKIQCCRGRVVPYAHGEKDAEFPGKATRRLIASISPSQMNTLELDSRLAGCIHRILPSDRGGHPGGVFVLEVPVFDRASIAAGGIGENADTCSRHQHIVLGRDVPQSNPATRRGVAPPCAIPFLRLQTMSSALSRSCQGGYMIPFATFQGLADSRLDVRLSLETSASLTVSGVWSWFCAFHEAQPSRHVPLFSNS